MLWAEKLPTVTPSRTAVVYGLTGGIWILFSDQLVLAVAQNERMLTHLQTVKGEVFVIASTGLIYGLTLTQYQQREELIQRVHTELQQVSILHRILRHNVRNQCMVILGYLSLVSTQLPSVDSSAIDKIQHAADRLVTLSAKAGRLNREISNGKVRTQDTDVGTAVTTVVDLMSARYPDARIDSVVPDTPIFAVTPEALEWILEELLENAVEHNDRPKPRVIVTVATTPDEVTITVADNGPGLPAIERELSEITREEPLLHSQGIGLWVVRLLTTLSGGSYTFSGEEADDTTVELRFPKSVSPVLEAIHE